MQNTPLRVNVLDVGVNVTNMFDTVSLINSWIEGNEKLYVCVTGVHGVMECQQDVILKQIHNNSGLTVPDGMPMVWVGRMNGFKHISTDRRLLSRLLCFRTCIWKGVF